MSGSQCVAVPLVLVLAAIPELVGARRTGAPRAPGQARVGLTRPPPAPPRRAFVSPPDSVTRGLAATSITLRSSRLQSRSVAEIVIANAAGSPEWPSVGLELRHAGKVVGRGYASALSGGAERSVRIEFSLPPGTRMPADLEVSAAGRPIGSLRVGGRPDRITPLDVLAKTLTLDGSFFDIEVPRNSPVTVAWTLDPASAGAATGISLRIRATPFVSGDCPATTGDVSHPAAGVHDGTAGSFDFAAGDDPFETLKTYWVKGCLVDANALYTGNETNAVAFKITRRRLDLSGMLPKYVISDLSVSGGSNAASDPNQFQAGSKVNVSVTVKNIGASPTKPESVILWPRLQLVPDPWQSASPTIFVGQALKLPPLNANTPQTFTMSFTVPSVEFGLYKVKMWLDDGRKARESYLGSSLIAVFGDAPFLVFQIAKVYRQDCRACPSSWFGALDATGPCACTSSDIALVNVANVGSLDAPAFRVILSDVSGRNNDLVATMPALKAGTAAWSDYLYFGGVGGSAGPYTVRIAPPPHNGGSPAVTGLKVFKNVQVLSMADYDAGK